MNVDAGTAVGPASQETQAKTIKIAPGVSAFVQLDGSWGLSNSGLICGSHTALLVDTFFTESRNDRLLELVSGVTAVRPSLLVNTHHHGDHVYGNGWFPEAVVISHSSTREAVLKLDSAVSERRFVGVEFGETKPTPAVVTFDAALTLHIDEMTVDVEFPGNAHCPGNSTVFLRDHGVLFAGDLLLKNCTPTFSGGSAVGFLPVLKRLSAMGAEVVVPGHGPVCDGEVIVETERYISFVLDLAQHALARGETPLATALSADLGEFAEWCDPERLVGNLYRAMDDLAPEGPQGKLDISDLWRDTESFMGHSMRSLA